MKRFTNYIQERQEDIDDLELLTNPPRTREEMKERLANSRQIIGLPVKPLDRGHFSIVVSGHRGPYVLKYTHPRTKALDGWYYWGLHCYKLWKERFQAFNAYPNVQHIQEFEDDHGFFAIMEHYNFLEKNPAQFHKNMHLNKVWDYMKEYWGHDDIQKYYSDVGLQPYHVDQDNIPVKAALSLLHWDMRMGIESRNGLEGPFTLSMIDVYSQNNIVDRFDDAIYDIIEIAKHNRLHADIHSGNIAFTNSSKPVIADPLSWKQGQVGMS